MSGKRKRQVLEDFDPNKSDSEDENFDPTDDRPRKTSRKARNSRGPSKPRRHNRYRGSDIEDDGEVSDSMGEGSFPEDSEGDQDAPTNAAGRRARKAAVKQQNYAEDSDSGEEAVAPSDEEEAEPEPPKRTGRIVKLKFSKPTAQGLRRATRSHIEEADDFVELSNSGRHAVPSRDSRSRSPEAYARRPSRGTKGLKKPPETIEEATQEDSSKKVTDDADEPDELSQDMQMAQQQDFGDEDIDEVEKVEGDLTADKPDEVAVDEDDDDDDDDDDVPLTRRGRPTRASVSAPGQGDSDAGATRRSGRLTRGSRSKRGTQEPSSDFEPGDDSDDGAMSPSERGRHEDMQSPTPRPRTKKRETRTGRSSRDDSGSEPEVDLDELNEEARELKKTSRGRRRRPRTESPIAYETSRRARTKVNYFQPPLTSVNIEEEEVLEPAATPARGRGRRAGASTLWERNLNTTFGPFGGGGGAGSLLNGPWGTGAAGGVDSDSSDDEMVHRSNVANNVGMTPTSAAPGGLLPGGLGLNNAETPNVGKIKDRKALADADPLGVDLNVDFSQVGGLQGHIDQLKEMVQLPLLYPELFLKFHVTPPRGVLFHGPPGTGKTLLARALANSVGSGGKKISFYMRKGADALSKWVGEAEKQLRLLFEEARKNQPSIIFFDEIDGLAPVRSSKQEQIHASIVSTLLALMDGMDGRGQVIVIGATNRPDNIDPALRRPGRFDREFYFPLPDIEGRKSILNIHTKDWGLSEDFKTLLAERTKGYGGADMRALCTEAALNAIQRNYPQIYSTTEKLVVNPDKITVHASDFMISIKKLVPSSERSATTGARPLPKSIEPLLSSQFNDVKKMLDEALPRGKKHTALEEAMYEQFDDADHGFGRETLYQEFERSRIFRPRFIVHGKPGMGQGYISSAILHYFEGVHVQNFDLPALMGDERSTDQVIVGLFAEVRRHRPSVIFIPNIDGWYEMLQGTSAMKTFQTMLKSIPATDPVLLLATAESESALGPPELMQAFFGLSRKNGFVIKTPDEDKRREFFGTTLDYVKKKPAEFPDPANRPKRVLEELPVAPPVEPEPPTKDEMKSLKRRDHQLLNGLKIQLQPIMDQINRKYKKFRQPVIAQAQIEYLFTESHPDFIRPDVAEPPQGRPFEIVKDKLGNDVLRETATGKHYYNLETTTIEERLSNGFYTRPTDFLFDIKCLAKDSKNSGDKERTLKANELLSNVEVDVASIENSTSHIDWEALFRRQTQRSKQAAEKERRRKAMQSIVNRVQSDLGGGNDSDSQGPVTLGEQVPGSTTVARFQVRSPLHDGGDTQEEPHPLSNGTTHADADVQMSGVDESTQAVSAMGPPPKSQVDSQRTGAPISQKSAVTSLPPGVSPSAVLNDASTTKTSDPSTNRSSNFSTQATNGTHAEHRTDDNDVEIPDTLLTPSQLASSSGEQWPHSQAHGLRQGHAGDDDLSSQSQARPAAPGIKGMNASILNDSPASENHHPSSTRNSGSSASQPSDLEKEVRDFLHAVTDYTADCTIEQLEQINRDMMDAIWKSRNEWNRSKVLGYVKSAFNDTFKDIEDLQQTGPSSQRRSL